MTTESLDAITRYEVNNGSRSNFSVHGLTEHEPIRMGFDWAAAKLVGMLLASSLMTGPAHYLEPNQYLRYASSSVFSPFRQRRGRRVSATEARQIALQVLAEAKRELSEERAEEARFLISFWDDDLPGPQ